MVITYKNLNGTKLSFLHFQKLYFIVQYAGNFVYTRLGANDYQRSGRVRIEGLKFLETLILSHPTAQDTLGLILLTFVS